MPEHFHLLISEPEKGDPSEVMQVLKQRFARQVLTEVRRNARPDARPQWDDAAEHVWQKRFYDFNVWSARKHVEKLRYMHRNPVSRGLVSEPDPVAVEQLSLLCLPRGGACRDQCSGIGEVEDTASGCLSSPPTLSQKARNDEAPALADPTSTTAHRPAPNPWHLASSQISMPSAAARTLG